MIISDLEDPKGLSARGIQLFVNGLVPPPQLARGQSRAKPSDEDRAVALAQGDKP